MTEEQLSHLMGEPLPPRAAPRAAPKRKAPRVTHRAPRPDAPEGTYFLSDQELPAWWHDRYSTGFPELDALLDPDNPGLRKAFRYLFYGQGGAGKTTLTAQIVAHVAATHRVLFVANEQHRKGYDLVALMKRIEANIPNQLLCAALSTPEGIIRACHEFEPAFVVIDSLQTLGPSQMEHAKALRELGLWFQDREITSIFINRSTKNGKAAGSNSNKHEVDAVFGLERRKDVRVLVVEKNRGGPTEQRLFYDIHKTGIAFREVDEVIEDDSGLAEWMKETGYTNKSLATALGVNPSAVSHWRTGSNSPSAEHLAHLRRLGFGQNPPAQDDMSPIPEASLTDLTDLFSFEDLGRKLKTRTDMNGAKFKRVGKKRAGRNLDGKLHHDSPNKVKRGS